ncbi:helix-turn-helix domain-containing protein [Clostridium sp.]|uniref:helix-turn-helix domain-containing protein n=1 Tax=Clostridium sp. TaxID=1506 RepID=UPI001A40D39A|nr:helix-turn-helix domain-containing protein [Clostridium sp.]MBK5240235.1 helix-turn-helix domain-containing protein [Clostridium sp.]
MSVNNKQKKLTGTIFNTSSNKTKSINDIRELTVDIEKLIKMQYELLKNKYNSDCLNVKQLQEVLNVGETNIYTMLKQEKLPFRTIGRRKVVTVMALANYLMLGINIEK